MIGTLSCIGNEWTIQSGGLVEIAEHVTTVVQEAKLLAEAAERGGLDVDIETCPGGWDIRELLQKETAQ